MKIVKIFAIFVTLLSISLDVNEAANVAAANDGAVIPVDPLPCDEIDQKYANCISPLVWDPDYCRCKCPNYKTCSRNQYFDTQTCTCRCIEPCRDCVKPQTWSERTCKCQCQFMVSCERTHYFDHETCSCQCKQTPRKCCPTTIDIFKIWDPRVCDCVCAKTELCKVGYRWDKYFCKCVPIGIKYTFDNLAFYVDKIVQGIDDRTGVDDNTPGITAAPATK